MNIYNFKPVKSHCSTQCKNLETGFGEIVVLLQMMNALYVLKSYYYNNVCMLGDNKKKKRFKKNCLKLISIFYNFLSFLYRLLQENKIQWIEPFAFKEMRALQRL